LCLACEGSYEPLLVTRQRTGWGSSVANANVSKRSHAKLTGDASRELECGVSTVQRVLATLRAAGPLASRLELLRQGRESLCVCLEWRPQGRVLHLLRPLTLLVCHRTARSRSGREFSVGEIERHMADSAGNSRAPSMQCGLPRDTVRLAFEG
jgi:hypothetical protein